MPSYEYKCIPGPTLLVVKTTADFQKAINSYSDLINADAIDGWEFYSMESMTVQDTPGCFSGGKTETKVFNMMVFRREKA